MDQLSGIVVRARSIAMNLPSTHPNVALGEHSFWFAVYQVVCEVSGFEQVMPEDGKPWDISAHPEFRSHNVAEMDDLIRLIQKHQPDFCPTGEGRPQLLRRQVATAIVDLTDSSQKLVV